METEGRSVFPGFAHVGMLLTPRVSSHRSCIETDNHRQARNVVQRDELAMPSKVSAVPAELWKNCA